LNHEFVPGARSYHGHTGSLLDEPAKAIKAGSHGVPGGENMLFEPLLGVRYFTVRECARLQGFPDDYYFPGTWTTNTRQIGNAVPIVFANIIASSIKRALTINR
jgi:DNA (cytosine-5)-methyltransferase 1